MLDAEARQLAAQLEDRVAAGAEQQQLTATVRPEPIQPETSPLPGGAQPRMVRYRIEIADGSRVARLDLRQAGELLDTVEPGCDPERLFAAVRAQEIPIESSQG